MDIFDKAAAEARFLEDEMGTAPDRGVALEQAQLAGLQFAVAEVVERQVRALNLDADELGPRDVGLAALLLQPVSADQPWRVVVGRGADGGDQGSAWGRHAPILTAS